MSFALMVLVACTLLHLAARLLIEALPVLVPAGVFVVVAGIAWRWYSRSDRW